MHLATHDALTDLPNRAFFYDRLDRALRKTRRKNEGLVVLLLDVDRFKEINDTFGHAAGDEVLREVAQRLIMATRDSDSVARLGGDEFAIVLHSASEMDGARVAARVSECFNTPVPIGSEAVKVKISTGWAVFPQDGPDAETLLKRADEAMYIAKRGRVEDRDGTESSQERFRSAFPRSSISHRARQGHPAKATSSKDPAIRNSPQKTSSNASRLLIDFLGVTGSPRLIHLMCPSQTPAGAARTTQR